MVEFLVEQNGRLEQSVFLKSTRAGAAVAYTFGRGEPLMQPS